MLDTAWSLTFRIERNAEKKLHDTYFKIHDDTNKCKILTDYRQKSVNKITMNYPKRDDFSLFLNI